MWPVIFPRHYYFMLAGGVCGNLIRLHYLKSQWSKLISHLPSVWDHLHLALEWRLELFPHLSCCDFPCLFCFSFAPTRLIACSGARRPRACVINIRGSKGHWVIECLLIMWRLFAYISFPLFFPSMFVYIYI